MKINKKRIRNAVLLDVCLMSTVNEKLKRRKKIKKKRKKKM
jgi:hypothetical protein